MILLGLATWRVSSLLVSENGPGNILAKLRYFTGVRMDELSNPVGENVVADALTCVWCTSFWVGLLFFAVWLLNPQAAYLISIPLALSTIAIVVEKVVTEGG